MAVTIMEPVSRPRRMMSIAGPPTYIEAHARPSTHAFPDPFAAGRGPPPASVTRASHGRHKTVTRSSQDRHTFVTCSSHVRHMFVTCSSHGRHMVVTWSSHGRHTAICTAVTSAVTSATPHPSHARRQQGPPPSSRRRRCRSARSTWCGGRPRPCPAACALRSRRDEEATCVCVRVRSCVVCVRHGIASCVCVMRVRHVCACARAC